MSRLLISFLIILLTITNVFGYAIKVYDEYGNRVGTYKKEGDNYQFYDFNDNKVDNPNTIIKNAPEQTTLTEYSHTFYDENMIPIGTWRSGFYGNDGKYYPRYGQFFPSNMYKTNTPYIVRPSAKNNFNLNNNNINYIDTRFPRFTK